MELELSIWATLADDAPIPVDSRAAVARARAYARSLA
jgi:hypothetical protein